MGAPFEFQTQLRRNSFKHVLSTHYLIDTIRGSRDTKVSKTQLVASLSPWRAEHHHEPLDLTGPRVSSLHFGSNSPSLWDTKEA